LLKFDKMAATVDKQAVQIADLRKRLSVMENERDEAIAHAFDFESGEVYYRLQRERDEARAALAKIRQVFAYVEERGAEINPNERYALRLAREALEEETDA
jgi:cell division protein FtsB